MSLDKLHYNICTWIFFQSISSRLCVLFHVLFWTDKYAFISVWISYIIRACKGAFLYFFRSQWLEHFSGFYLHSCRITIITSDLSALNGKAFLLICMVYALEIFVNHSFIYDHTSILKWKYSQNIFSVVKKNILFRFCF